VVGKLRGGTTHTERAHPAVAKKVAVDLAAASQADWTSGGPTNHCYWAARPVLRLLLSATLGILPAALGGAGKWTACENGTWATGSLGRRRNPSHADLLVTGLAIGVQATKPLHDLIATCRRAISQERPDQVQ